VQFTIDHAGPKLNQQTDRLWTLISDPSQDAQPGI